MNVEYFKKLNVPAFTAWIKTDCALQVRQILELQGSLKAKPLTELKTCFSNLLEEISNSDSSTSRIRDHWQSTACAIGLEAIRRTEGFQLHDVQIEGALLAASNKIIQMQTGEGKTIVCVLTAIIRSIFDSSIHIATTNDYLAQRDHETAAPIFDLLGIESGVVLMETPPQKKKATYRKQVVYGAGHTFGFDYLRDQLTLRKKEKMTLGRQIIEILDDINVVDDLFQHERCTVLVDEADSVLIDESTTPLILSGPSAAPEKQHKFAIPFQLAKQVAHQLRPEKDFEKKDGERQVSLLENGHRKIHHHLRQSTKLELTRPWTQYVENALYAANFLVRGEHYVVSHGEIKLVDQHTGRIFDDRTLKNGLHQAVEAKENLEIKPANQSLARITRQSFFRLYKNICGMSGTITGSEKELRYFYGVSTQVVAPHKTCQRVEYPARVFKDTDSKLDGIANEVIEANQSGRPVLIGTRTITESLKIFEHLKERGLSIQILNGVQEEEEASIIKNAGMTGAITIATNMAGRGTDFKLDNRSLEAGGLYVIVSQPSDSRRVDRQLIGRTARQGQPGAFRFFVSLEDELLKHDRGIIKWIGDRTTPDASEFPAVMNRIRSLQQAKDKENFEQRKKLVEYDEYMDRLRANMVS